MIEWTSFVADLAVVTTIFQFLSGMLVCKQYAINKTTAEASPLPFLSGILSCFLWFFYGLNKNDNRIIVVNVIGVTLMAAYTVVFYIFTYKKATLLKQVAFLVVIAVAVLYSANTCDDSQLVLKGLGYSASFVTLLTIIAPMSKLRHVIKVRNTECLPFPMILMSFFVSILWSLYGYLNKDSFVMIVNLIAIVFAAAQLCLFLICPRTSTTVYKHITA